MVSNRTISRAGRFFSTGSDKFNGLHNSSTFEKVEEAETVHVPPPPTEKLLVLGGNGFVGSHILKEAVNRGLTVSSLSRSGRSSIHVSMGKQCDMATRQPFISRLMQGCNELSNLCYFLCWVFGF